VTENSPKLLRMSDTDILIVARIGQALGFDVIAYTAGAKDNPEKRKDDGYIVPGIGDPDGLIPSAWYSGTDKASLHEFLKQDIDVLVVSVPLTYAVPSP
jgi:hypothetical protein